MTSWRLLLTGHRSGHFNMALDRALLRAAAEAEQFSPVVRLYGWDPPAVSIGRGQALEQAVDGEACRASGVDLVRRPTGGRAVLHDQELTYSVITVGGAALWAPRIQEAYRLIGEALLRGCARLGIAATVERSGRLPSARQRAGLASLCFAATAQYELLAGGKKLIGSAQRRCGRALLQHGSIPLYVDVERLLRLTGLGSEENAAIMGQKTTDLACAAGRAITFAEACTAFASGFSSVLGTALGDGDLTPGEREMLGEELEQTPCSELREHGGCRSS